MFSNQKIAKILLEKITSNKVENIKHVDIASELGLSLKTVEREIKILKDRNVISGKRGFYRIVDRKFLEMLSQESSQLKNNAPSFEDIVDLVCRVKALEIIADNSPDKEGTIEKIKMEMRPFVEKQMNTRRKIIYASRMVVKILSPIPKSPK